MTEDIPLTFTEEQAEKLLEDLRASDDDVYRMTVDVPRGIAIDMVTDAFPQLDDD